MTRAVATVGALLLVTTVAGCGVDEAGTGGAGPPAQETASGPEATVSDSLERAQARVTRKVIDMEGVTGTAMGLCNGRPCIKVYLESDSSALRSRLPRSESGFPVVAEVTGKIRRP